MPDKRPALYVKRGFDVVASAAGLAVLSPVLAGVTVAELVFHGWPPLFSQERPGLHGKIFQMRKFRTMTNERGPDGELLPDAERLTPFGRFLRSTSLDELPELWHVLTGEMSLVGPRPLLVRYLDRYTAEQMRRHEMPPGITGWAQVNGRNSVAWDERFRLDVWYVDHWSLWLDLRVLASTLGRVIRRDGIAQEGHATMTEFSGPTIAEA
jgi:lipopolysaccharide/colanic/teichoic acid biosynthesis glycosyltransferase